MWMIRRKLLIYQSHLENEDGGCEGIMCTCLLQFQDQRFSSQFTGRSAEKSYYSYLKNINFKETLTRYFLRARSLFFTSVPIHCQSLFESSDDFGCAITASSYS